MYYDIENGNSTSYYDGEYDSYGGEYDEYYESSEYDDYYGGEYDEYYETDPDGINYQEYSDEETIVVEMDF